MSSKNDEERSPEFWRGLADLALMEARRTTDRDTKEALHTIASKYMALANKIDASRRGPSASDGLPKLNNR